MLAVRVILRRSDLEALPLAVFRDGRVSVRGFKQARTFTSSGRTTLRCTLRWAGPRRSRARSTWSRAWPRNMPRFRGGWQGYAGLGLGAFMPLLILPDGLRALRYAHRSGGRFNENGHLTKPDKDKVARARVAERAHGEPERRHFAPGHASIAVGRLVVAAPRVDRHALAERRVQRARPLLRRRSALHERARTRVAAGRRCAGRRGAVLGHRSRRARR